jgi:hypothetical protein
MSVMPAERMGLLFPLVIGGQVTGIYARKTVKLWSTKFCTDCTGIYLIPRIPLSTLAKGADCLIARSARIGAVPVGEAHLNLFSDE